ncbi:MAG: carboxypeptidase regulatory-like domain-containing protein [Vicinamibacterales bacterium]
MLQRPLRPLAVAAVISLLSASSVFAQMGRVGGLVRTEGGEPIRGATVTAENENFGLSITATTDDRGRFSIIGLRIGMWTFTAEAPGFIEETGEMQVRIAGAPNPPIAFALRRSEMGPSAALGNVSTEEVQAQLAEADTLYQQGEWSLAIEAYQAILERTPALNTIRLQIASAHRQNNAPDAAIVTYEELIRLDPANEKARIGIAMVHLERGDAATAERLLFAAAALPSAKRETFYSLGEVLAARSASADAATWFARAASADPSWGKPLYRLGELALDGGDQAAAAKYLAEVVAVAPASAEAELARATLSRIQ